MAGQLRAVHGIAQLGEAVSNEAHLDGRTAQAVQKQNANPAAFDCEACIRRHGHPQHVNG